MLSSSQCRSTDAVKTSICTMTTIIIAGDLARISKVFLATHNFHRKTSHMTVTVANTIARVADTQRMFCLARSATSKLGFGSGRRFQDDPRLDDVRSSSKRCSSYIVVTATYTKSGRHRVLPAVQCRNISGWERSEDQWSCKSCEHLVQRQR